MYSRSLDTFPPSELPISSVFGAISALRKALPSVDVLTI